MTKILHVSGDDDYGALQFEQDCKLSAKEAWEDSNTKGTYVEWTQGCYYSAYTFGEVDKDFIEFVKGEQDYDDSKHNDWIVID